MIKSKTKVECIVEIKIFKKRKSEESKWINQTRNGESKQAESARAARWLRIGELFAQDKGGNSEGNEQKKNRF